LDVIDFNLDVMIESLKNLYHKYSFFKMFFFPFKLVNDWYWKRLSDEKAIKLKFKKSFGYRLDLNNPISLNEKIQWLKLYYRTELHTVCADKIAVRDYVKSVVGDKYLIPLFLITDDLQDVSSDNTPNVPFIVKANHDSGSYKIVLDKAEVNWTLLRTYFKKKLKKNYYLTTKEWPYKNIQPKVLVEKLLIPEGGGTPNDYKLHCFNGKVHFIQVDFDRGSKNHTRNWYNIGWERVPFYWASLIKGILTVPNNMEIDKPKSLDLMINLAEKLSSPFPYVRIDFYDIDNKVYFGEITFYQDNGFRPIYPPEWDLKLGELITLPNKK